MVIGVRAAWCEVHFWEVELPVEYLISCRLTYQRMLQAYVFRSDLVVHEEHVVIMGALKQKS